MVEANGISWYLSPISTFNLHRKSMIIYDPTSPSSSRSESKCFLVPRGSDNKISCPFNDFAIPITKATPVMVYFSCFNPSWTWAHFYNTLSARGERLQKQACGTGIQGTRATGGAGQRRQDINHRTGGGCREEWMPDQVDRRSKTERDGG